MHFRIKRLILFMCLAIGTTNGFCQRRLTYSLEVSGSATWFGINKRSPDYNDKWQNIDVTFKPKLGYSCGIGLDYVLNDKLKLFGKLRYHQWGGYIHANRQGSTYFFELDINYQSMSIPLGISYTFKQTPKFNYAIRAGGGFDNSFKLNYTGATKYGAGPEQISNISIHTGYLLLGFDWGFKVSNKLSGYMSIEVNNDMLLNPNRNQNFQGFFKQIVIPLNYNMMMINLGVRI